MSRERERERGEVHVFAYLGLGLENSLTCKQYPGACCSASPSALITGPEREAMLKEPDREGESEREREWVTKNKRGVNAQEMR